MRYIASLLICLTISSVTFADISLSALFTDHIVLQQKSKANIWGKANPNEKITVITSWNNKKYKITTPADGKWNVRVSTPRFGGPYHIILEGKNTVILNNVMIGDVYFCSGQSNMEMPLAGWGKVLNYEQEIANADYPNIRILHMNRMSSNHPSDSLSVRNVGWYVCAPKNIPDFSAVAYFFAREINRKTKIPIGLIQSAWSGTPIEPWISYETFVNMDSADSKQVEIAKSLKGRQQKYNIYKGTPTALYNAMINPFIKYTIKGVLWYQGENNAPKAKQYSILFPALIKDWREKFQNKDMPFYFVQLANFRAKNDNPNAKSEWAELRDAQLMTLKNTPNTGMAVAVDIGDAKDIHPKNKQEVGRRLALIALNKTYKNRNEFSGPIYKEHSIRGNKVYISFAHNRGLYAKNGKLLGFTVAGKNKKFYQADASINKNKIIVSCDSVRNPVSVRYSWADNPSGNLYNKADLPASPFRTDDW